MSYSITTRATLMQDSSRYILLNLSPELENDCSGRIVAVSDDARAYYIADSGVYELFYHDSSNTQLLIEPLPDTDQEKREHTVVSNFKSVVELEPCAPILGKVLVQFPMQEIGAHLVSPVYLSRLLAETEYIATPSDIYTYLGAISALPCDISASQAAGLFAGGTEYPVARFNTSKIAELLMLSLYDFLGKTDAISATLSTLTSIIQTVITTIPWGIIVHAIISLASAINREGLTFKRLGNFVKSPQCLRLTADSLITLSPRRLLASIIYGYIVENGGHKRRGNVLTIEFTFETIYSRVANLSLPTELFAAFILEAQLDGSYIQEVQETYSLPVAAYADLLLPRAIKDPCSSSVSACWMTPGTSLSMGSQLTYIERLHLSHNQLHRAFELLDIQAHWQKRFLVSLMSDVCAPTENVNVVIERYTRELNTLDNNDAVVIEKGEKRVLLSARILSSQ